jgi:dephospho-CoA kinase
MPPFKGPKPVIGILGGIGAGKSRVAQAFAALGCGVIDADKLAREALATRAAALEVAGWWGPGVIGADGLPDRKAIAARVFNQPAELEKLEGLLHPMVFRARDEMVKEMNADPKIVAIVEDCPLLLEKKLNGACDVLVFVDASLETRTARVIKSRGWSHEELVRRELRQMPLDIKRKRADYVILNEEDSDCAAQASRVLQTLRSQH